MKKNQNISATLQSSTELNIEILKTLPLQNFTLSKYTIFPAKDKTRGKRKETSENIIAKFNNNIVAWKQPPEDKSLW